MKPSTLHPFADESTALQIGGLTVENRSDRVSIFGNLDLTRDKPGLHRALELKSILDQVVTALQEQALPDAITIEPPVNVKNPLGR